MKTNGFGTFVRYTALSVLGMIGLSCYVLADTYFIALGLGAEGLAALNLAIPVYSTMNGVGLMLGMGSATRYTILKSQNDRARADRLFTNTLAATLLVGLLLAFAGLFASGQITALMQADEQIFAMTNTYIRVVLLFAPAFMLNNLFACYVRNDGAPHLAMAAQLTGSFSNILLDYVFIFPLGLGLFGAVLATGLAPFFSMAVLSLHRIKRKNRFHLVRTRPLPRVLAAVCALGVPSLVNEISSAVVLTVFNLMFMRLMGNTGVAAYGVVANLSLVALAIFTGVSQGVQPLLSRAYGKREERQIERFLHFAMASVLALAATIYLTFFLFAEPIVAAFNTQGDAALQQTAEQGVKLYFLAMFFAGINIVLACCFASIEKARPAQAIAVLRGLVLVVPLALLMAALGGVSGLWLSFPLAEALVALLGAGLWLRQKRRGFFASPQKSELQ